MVTYGANNLASAVLIISPETSGLKNSGVYHQNSGDNHGKYPIGKLKLFIRFLAYTFIRIIVTL
jgi:hypothetical protein